MFFYFSSFHNQFQIKPKTFQSTIATELWVLRTFKYSCVNQWPINNFIFLMRNILHSYIGTYRDKYLCRAFLQRLLVYCSPECIMFQYNVVQAVRCKIIVLLTHNFIRFNICFGWFESFNFVIKSFCWIQVSKIYTNMLTWTQIIQLYGYLSKDINCVRNWNVSTRSYKSANKETNRQYQMKFK